MISPEVSNLIAGKSDEAIDVRALFESDARGQTGLFAGQLVAELIEARPAVAPRVIEAIRRGLISSDAREQQAALSGAAALRDQVDLTRELTALVEAVPALASTRAFIDVVATQPNVAATPLVDRLAALPMSGEAHTAMARLLVRNRPESVRTGLVAALSSELSTDELGRQGAFIRALSPSDVKRVADALATTSQDVRARASRYFFEVLEAATNPVRYDRWMGLHTRLCLSLDSVPPRPYESPEAVDQRQRLAARLAAMVAATETAPSPVAPVAAPAAVVLSTPVWLDALRVPDGPPGELYDLLRRHHVTVLRSDALLDEVEVALRKLGWDDAGVGRARARMIEATQARDPSSDGFALAKAAGLDAIYGVGPSTGQSHDGVTVRPVHELLTLLQRVPSA